MPVEIPTKYLAGNDRNSQRIRRLAQWINQREERGLPPAALKSFYDEFERRIGGNKRGKAGVTVNVPKMG